MPVGFFFNGKNWFHNYYLSSVHFCGHNLSLCHFPVLWPKKKRDAKNWSNSSSLRLITFAVPVNDINWHFTQWRYVFTSLLNIETCFFVLQAVATRTQALEMFFFKCLVALSCFLRGQFIWKPGHFVWLQQEVSCFLILWQLCSSLLFKPKVDDCMNLT